MPNRLAQYTLIAAVAGVLAISSSGSAGAQPVPPPVQVVAESPVAIEEADQPVRVLVINTGAAQRLFAGAAPEAPLALAFGTEGAECDNVGRTASTTADVPSGATALLAIVGCGELDGSSHEIAVWASGAEGVARVEVKAGTAASRPAVPLPPKIRMDVNDSDTTASKSLCLPKAAGGRVGYVEREGDLHPVEVAATEGATCAAEASRSVVTVSSLSGPGAYTGSIDGNGAADGGDIPVVVNLRAPLWLFWLLLGVGIVAATLLSWQTRFGRHWGFISEAEAQIRAEAWSHQERILNAGDAPSADRWTVVSDEPPKAPERPLDVALEDYVGDRKLRRLLKPPLADRLADGAKLKEVLALAAAYKDAVAAGLDLAQWLEVNGDAAAGPTVEAVKSSLADPQPRLNPVKRLHDDAISALAVTAEFDRLRRAIAAVRRRARETGDEAAVGRADELGCELARTDLSQDDAVAALRSKLQEIDGAVDGDGVAGLDLLLRPTETWELAEAMPGVFWSRQPETPAQALEGVRRRNAWAEIGFGLLGLVIAAVSAYAALYAPNPAWGTELDMLAAVTWAVTAGAAVQVARHFTARIE